MHTSLDSALGRQRRLNQIGETINSIATPAAAFSLRSLTGGDPLAVRVRRSGDNTDQDFTVSEVASGALLNYINEDVVTEQSDFTSGVDSYAKDSQGTVSREASFEGKSDVLKYEFASSGRFGIKKTSIALDLTSSYTITFEYYADTAYNGKFWGIEDAFADRVSASNTPAVVSDAWTSVTLNVPSGRTTGVTSLHIRLQAGTSDTFGLTGITANVRFKNIVVTQTTGSGFVDTWYDQSGNDRHAVQNTDAQQPIIVESGTFQDGLKFTHADTTNGKRLSFDRDTSQLGTEFALVWVGFYTGSSGTMKNILGATRGVQGYNSGSVSITATPSSNQFSFVNEQSGSARQILNATQTLAAETRGVVFASYDDDAVLISVNGNSNTSTFSSTVLTNTRDFNIMSATSTGGTYRTLESAPGTCSEVIVYDTNQVNNRTSIETNIINHYSIS
mgnify:CR=1 FL=1